MKNTEIKLILQKILLRNEQRKVNNLIPSDILDIKDIIKQLTLTDVVASVLCVNSKGYNYITNGVEYEIITESNSFIEVIDDEGDNCYYDKDCFKKL